MSGLAAALNVELAEDRRDVVCDRLLREEQVVGDLPVAKTPADQSEDLGLARGQAGGIVPRRRAWAPGQPTGAALTQAERDDRSGRRRAEPV